MRALLLLAVLAICSHAKLTFFSQCPTAFKTESFTPSSYAGVWYDIVISLSNWNTKCAARSLTYDSASDIFTLTYRYKFLSFLSVRSNGAMKCLSSNGRCYLNWWYLIDT